MPTCEALDEARGLLARGGEGSWGGDGFVASSAAAGQLEWLASFDFCNPIVEVHFQGECVVGRNNCGTDWYFPLANPAAVWVGKAL